MTVKEFKMLFKKYWLYVENQQRIKDKLDNFYYQLSGVKGIDYSKIPSTFNPELNQERRLELIEDINILQAQLNTDNQEYLLMKMIMPKLTNDEVCLLYRLIVDNESYEVVSQEYGYTASGLWKYVSLIIESVI